MDQWEQTINILSTVSKENMFLSNTNNFTGIVSTADRMLKKGEPTSPSNTVIPTIVPKFAFNEQYNQILPSKCLYNSMYGQNEAFIHSSEPCHQDAFSISNQNKINSSKEKDKNQPSINSPETCIQNSPSTSNQNKINSSEKTDKDHIKRPMNPLKNQSPISAFNIFIPPTVPINERYNQILSSSCSSNTRYDKNEPSINSPDTCDQNAPSTSNQNEINLSKKRVEDHIKQPMNAFMVWSKKRRREISVDNPKLRNSEISKRLGTEWKLLDIVNKKSFIDEAKRLRVEHKEMYPHYKFKPKRKPKAVEGSKAARFAAAAKAPQPMMSFSMPYYYPNQYFSPQYSYSDSILNLQPHPNQMTWQNYGKTESITEPQMQPPFPNYSEYRNPPTTVPTRDYQMQSLFPNYGIDCYPTTAPVKEPPMKSHFSGYGVYDNPIATQTSESQMHSHFPTMEMITTK